MDVAERRAYEGVISRAAEIALSDPSAFIELFARDEKNRPIVQAPLHRDMQREWTRSRYLVMAVPRLHGKTTQALARVAWEIVRDQNIRVKIVAATDADAADCVVVVRAILEQESVRQAYPWVRLAPDRSQSKGRFTVVRSATHMRDSTVRGIGILASAAGGRADLIVFDDPVTMQNALRQPALRKQVTKTFFAVYFPMIGPDDFRLWYIGTPWHEADLLSGLLKGIDVQKKPAIFQRVVTEALESPWPGYWTKQRLGERQEIMPPAEFARAFFLRAIADEDTVCAAEWLREESVRSDDRVSLILGVDPASGKQGKNDYTAVSVLETHGDFVLIRDVVRFRVPFPEQIGRIMELRKTLRPEYIAVEDVGTQKWMLDELHNQGCSEAIASDPIRDNKAARFRVLGLRHKQGVIRLARRRTAGLVAYRDELTGFPVAEHDDTLDAVSLALKAAENARLVEPAPAVLGEVDEETDRNIRAEDIGIYLPRGGADDEGKDEWAGW